ncbi:MULTISPECIES: YtxH domain-containing protein [Limnobaculum]|nr:MULTISPECIES: YtxH domain-containing protein [Limnobaculum]
MGKDKKSNDQEIPEYQGMPPYGPYGYPYYPPYPQQQGQPMPQQMMWPPHPPMWNPMCGQPPMGYPMPPQYQQFPPQFQQPAPQQMAPGFDWSGQAQGMVEGLMGEQAGLFKNIISTIGVDDKEFWKGAMIGAAAALILGNESVRNTLLQTFANAGDMLKSGGSKVKEKAETTAESVKESVMTSGAIFRDTVQAGKEGFQESVERHREQEKADE